MPMPIMFTTLNIWRLFSVRSVIRKTTSSCFNRSVRTYADSSKPGSSSRQVVVQGTENVERLRVRRARASDVPRLLSFVRANVRVAWPSLVCPSATSHVILADYVTRALAQGHSTLAEQLEMRRGTTEIRGLALSIAVCPWDAAVLEHWAHCVKCSRSRTLMNFMAHCLRAPALHDKYKVHHILQVLVIIPPGISKSGEIANILAKNTIKRGRESGFSVIRFDVSDNLVLRSLEPLKLKKEWHLSYQIIPHTSNHDQSSEKKPSSKKRQTQPETTDNKNGLSGNYIAVYTALIDKGKVPST